MFEGHARLRAVERGQVCAYPLGTRLAYMQPGASSTANACAACPCSGSVPGMRSCAPTGTAPAPGSWAERMIIMSSSYEPTSATAGHAATAPPARPCPRP